MSEVTATPVYFDKLFFENILNNASLHSDKTVSVENVKVEIGTKPGDNYTSEIYRAKINYTAGEERRGISLIIKHMPDVGVREEVLDNLQCYEREVEMYCQTVPAMSKLLANEMFCARCFHSTKTPCKMMVLQDLRALNYIMVERKAGLDLSHSLVVMRKIARFHAASMALAKRQVGVMKSYHFGMFNLEVENVHFAHLFNESLKSLSKAVAKWEGFETIAAKLKKMKANFMERIYDHVKTDNDTIQVLNHGDLWTNNMLFQYNKSSEPQDVLFVDYQLTFYSTPGTDLNYFLWTSPTAEVRENRWDELIQEYHNELQTTLVGLNHSAIPTLDDIKQEIQKRYFYGFVSSVAVLPLILMEQQSEVGSGMEAIMDVEKSASVRDLAFSGAQYQRVMKYNLLRYDEFGILD